MTTKRKPEWEKQFDNDIAPNITEYGGISKDEELEEEIKAFIRSLLKAERTRIKGIVKEAKSLLNNYKCGKHKKLNKKLDDILKEIK